MSFDSVKNEWEKRKRGDYNPEAYIKQFENMIKESEEKAIKYREKTNRLKMLAKEEKDNTKIGYYEKTYKRWERESEKFEKSAKQHAIKLDEFRNLRQNLEYEQPPFDAGGNSIRYIKQTIKPNGSKSILWSQMLDPQDNSRVLNRQNGKKAHGHIVIRSDGTKVFNRSIRGKISINDQNYRLSTQELEEHKEKILNSDEFKKLRPDQQKTLKRIIERDIDNRKHTETSCNMDKSISHQHNKEKEQQKMIETQNKTERSK